MIPTNATTRLLFLIIAVLSVSHPNTACTDQERQTLLSFLGSLSTPLKSWNTTSDCCKWEGITCNSFGSITEISLPNKGLTGEISPFLSNLTNLSYLNLSSNYLSGPLPVQLLSLSTTLQVLDVSFNKLSGGISGFKNPVIQVLNVSSNYFTGLLPFIDAPSLVLLNAANNSMTGPIPDYLCTHSPFLASLSISINNFCGKISKRIANCTALRNFHAGDNILTGPLPDELFEVTLLEHLSLHSNRISGSLNGPLLARLQNLVNLDLGGNFLTGSIPESVGQLNKLCYLQLNNNKLTGELPSSIENCTDLRQLNVRENSLNGSLQFINFTKLSGLQLLDLYNNNFTGEIPESIYTCKNLDALRLSRNQLSGLISPTIGNLTALSFLSFSLNSSKNITGTLQILSKCKNLTTLLITQSFIGDAMPIEPTWGNGFEKIQALFMAQSNLTGTIPSWIAKLTKLEVLDIAGNQLTGPIPDWLSNLSSLLYLDLSENYLSGNIPRSITQLPLLNSVYNIKQLDPGYLELPIYTINGNRQQYKQLTSVPPTINLGNNKLNGTIPLEIGQLTMLIVLNLGGNSISGLIPSSIGNLTNIEILDLSRNKLTGLLPPSLSQLHFLSTFSVAYNNLSGPVPTGGQLDTFANSTYEGNLNLCGTVVMRECSDPSNRAPLTSERQRFDKNIVIAVVLGFIFGVALEESIKRIFKRKMIHSYVTQMDLISLSPIHSSMTSSSRIQTLISKDSEVEHEFEDTEIKFEDI